VLLGLLLVGVTSLQATIGATPGLWVPAIVVLVGFTIFYGYYAIFEALQQGRTPGKQLVGLRVISADGRPITAQQALVRNLIRIVDSMPALYAIGIIAALVSPRSQRLGDMAAGTVVVHERPLGGEMPALPLRTAPPRLGASRLTAHEIDLIEAFLRRRADMDWELRERTAATVASRLRDRLGLAPGGSDEELLEHIVAEYRG
jgi:uncharacterized RDD family membrane protein YckC